MSRMTDFGRMQQIQREYMKTCDCPALVPALGRDKVLRMICALGEMVDIIKKEGWETVMEDEPTRKQFLFEIVDVMMYATVLIMCYGVTPEEMTAVYEGKHAYNYTRWDDTPEEDYILESRAARKGRLMDLFRCQQIARELRARYQWQPLVPEHGAETLLWLMGEVGEIIEIIIEKGDAAIENDAEVRREFLKEVTDVWMYLSEITIEFGFTPEALSDACEEKAAFNPTRGLAGREADA